MSTALMVLPKKHTPGEWKASGYGWVIALDVPKCDSKIHASDEAMRSQFGDGYGTSWDFYGGELICESISSRADEMLIAAAPRLLAALEAAMPWLEVLLNEHHTVHKQAVTALLMARGGFHRMISAPGDAEQNIRDLAEIYGIA
jgi:hypothetical protein